MLTFALEYRAAIDTITSDRTSGLRVHELNDTNWHVAKDLQDVLKLLKHATLFFSRATPSIAQVIPAMDHIDTVFGALKDNLNIHPAVRYAIALGKGTLNHYYELTDWATVYRIAMVLHPQHKLNYFKKLEWQADWITNARELTQTAFVCDYAHIGDTACATPLDSGAPDGKNGIDYNVFNSLPILTIDAAAHNELLTYFAVLCEQVPKTDPAALMWWYDRRAQFPRLSRMARDYLSIPATTVDVE